MGINILVGTAQALVSGGRGILAADETPPTLTKRFDLLGIESTPDTRMAYREMLFTTPGIGDFISGVILQDETIRQKGTDGIPLADVLWQHRLLPGIKVDYGTDPLAGSPGETITKGLDGLGNRLAEYRVMGARFAKWRAVIAVSDALPSATCVQKNADALARYAALCQEEGIVPIVEPEVLMDGSHTIERCEAVTGNVLDAVFNAILDHGVSLDGLLLKPNMVVSAMKCARQASVQEVALATLRVLGRHVPSAVPGIVFLSGGQKPIVATAHLSAINQLDAPTPWKLSFSFGRALQDEALEAWRGKPENLKAGQHAFYHRARCVNAASLGRYSAEMEEERTVS